jgi:hypothetical protein
MPGCNFNLLWLLYIVFICFYSFQFVDSYEVYFCILILIFLFAESDPRDFESMEETQVFLLPNYADDSGF